MDSMIVAPIVGLAAILFAICLLWSIRNKEKSTPQMIKIHEAIREGAKAFLQRQYKTMSLFIVLITILLGVFFDLLAAISFAIGAILSALASYLGMVIAVYFNIRTAQSARRSLKEALTTAYFAGAATGMLLTGLGLFSVGVLYFMSSGQPTKIVGLVFGASLVALFGRVGGGIYAKAADMGADLVGKLEARIPEDDEHNPAVIADLVGDNVGDVAGTGSDVYQSYVSALVSAMIIGLTTIPNAIGLLYPVAVLAIGVLSSIIATFFLKIYANNARLAINRVMYLSAVFAIVGAGSLAWLLFGSLTVFYVVSAGVIMAVLWAFLTEHFTSTDKPPVKMIAKSAQTGPATNVLAGFSIGMESIVFPTIILCIVVFGAFHLVGLYGVVMVTVGFLSVTSTFISMSAYGPIVDNADGILEISRTNSRATNVTAQLDAVGNTNKAICKGYAVGTSVLAQIAMFAVYIDQVNITLLNIVKPQVLIGLLIGSVMTFVFCSFLIKAVGKASFHMINEVRRQFKEIPGLMERRAKPDYAHCVDISTKAALKGLLVPSLMSILVPIAVGFLFGKEAYAGFILGNLITVLPLALTFMHSGAAWDNAKKLIEGNIVQRGSPAHSAAVIGDTIGDSFKDAVGPSLDILINVVGAIALLFAHLFAIYAIFA